MDSTLIPLAEQVGPFTAWCDPDEVLAYALATNDHNPAYLDGSAAPPIYAVVPAFTAFRSVPPLPPGATAGARGGVHGEHDLYIHRPIQPGVTLHVTAERYCVVTSRAGMNVFVRLRSTDDDGELITEQFWSSLSMGEVTGGDQGPPLADHQFPEEARSKLVGSMSLPTTRDQTYRYAGASGDRAPMHVNDKPAIAIGFPRKFNQGLCTLGVTSRGLIALAADGDPLRIKRIAVRFTSPTFPGDDIVVSVYDNGTTEGGLHSYAFEAASGGKDVLRHGRVEVAD